MEHAFLPLPPGSDGRLRRVQRETKPSSSTDYPWSSSQDSQRKTLNRKLEIQRRRNQVWRSQWSKVTTTKSESTLESNIIDESLSRAGLADVAKGVMETIDDILTELDRMNGAEDQSSGGSWDILGETKLPIANWDGERFKDLVVDLTSSVDTLYDISETRQRVKTSKVSNKFELNVEPEKAFEKARMDTPIFIDPSRILNYLSLESVVSRKSDGTKTLVFPASKDTFCLEPISGKSDASISPSDQPVFVEFAEYDDVYSATGIGPSMTRFEKLFSALQRQKTSAKAPKFGILNLLGYFEDVERSRYGLVYELPKKKEKEATTSMLQPRSESNYFHCRLAELMGHRQAEPPLEMKFRLAYRLATSVFDLHSRGVVHGRLAAANVLFFQASFREQDDQWQRSINIRRPYLTSFDLFPEPASNGDSNKEPLEVRWYRHKSDPRLDQNSRYTTESKELDLYSLSLLLMEIGLWQSLRESEFAISRNSMVLNVKGGNIDHVYEKLSTRCGSAYRKAIQACWEATEEKSAEGSQTNTRSDIHLQKLYGQVLRLLQRCCSIDEKWTDMDYDDVSPLDSQSPSAPTEPLTYLTPTPSQPSPLPPLPPPQRRSQPRTAEEEYGASSKELGNTDSGMSNTPKLSLSKFVKTRALRQQPSTTAGGPSLMDDQSFLDNLTPVHQNYVLAAFVSDTPGGETFALQSRKHLQKHSATFECSLCPKTFTRAVNLRSHMQAHADESLGKEGPKDNPASGDSYGLAGGIIVAEVSPKTTVDPATHSSPTSQLAANDPTDTDDVAQKQTPRRFPSVMILQEHLDNWHEYLMPQINLALKRFYRKHTDESVEISLENIGETPQKVKPTILVICTSVGKVKGVLKRHFSYDSTTYGLMVCRGKMLRSRKRRRAIKRSMGYGGGEIVEYEPANYHYQERPLNGASIGAYSEDQILMPVTFGGMVMVGGKPLGLTVHHMLDVPSDDEDEDDNNSSVQTIRSVEYEPHSSAHILSTEALDELGYELDGDDEDTASEGSSAYSDYTDDSFPAEEPGDIGGIDPEYASSYLVTQPAYDDVSDDFFKTAEDQVKSYLDTFTVGKLHSSSGLRRKECRLQKERNLRMVHEIDWALFDFNDDRRPPGNIIAPTYCCAPKAYPTRSVATKELGGLDIHTIGRTTGLRQGYIMSAVTSVKIKGRVTPSHSYQIAGGAGIPGDSGAWVLDNKEGRACGHILAWSDRKQVAYFCPMDVMLEDIAETLDVDVEFPPALRLPIEDAESHSVPKLKIEAENSSTEEAEMLRNISDGQARKTKTPVIKPLVKEMDGFELIDGMDRMHMSTEVLS